MTRTEAGYESPRNALAILERSLARMTRQRAGYKNFHFDAVQVVEEILKLRAEIDEYTGLAAFLREFGPPPADDPAPAVNGSAAGHAPQPTPAAAAAG
jgi:hypothetical protein